MQQHLFCPPPYCGILQLSAEIFRLEVAAKTMAKGIAVTGGHAINMHDLTTTHPSIRDAEENRTSQLAFTPASEKTEATLLSNHLNTSTFSQNM